jgi:hypothetical protein
MGAVSSNPDPESSVCELPLGAYIGEMEAMFSVRIAVPGPECVSFP